MAASASFDNYSWCVQQLLDAKSTASFDFDVNRGPGMFVMMQACWSDRAKGTHEAYTPSELSSKAALWQWFSSLQPHELLKVGTPTYTLFLSARFYNGRTLTMTTKLQVATVHDRPWVDLLLKLYRKQQSSNKGDGVWVPATHAEIPNTPTPSRNTSSGSRTRYIVE